MPRSAYRVAFQIDPAYARFVDTRRLSMLARRALRREGIGPPVELSVAVSDDHTVRSLNRRFRGENKATDVLSFALEGDDAFATPAGPRRVGEVIISYPTARAQARNAGHTVGEEMEHLLVHGILHILGYDHERQAETRRMRAREETLLGRAVH
jgi:probable rRNA maturation factor